MGLPVFGSKNESTVGYFHVQPVLILIRCLLEMLLTPWRVQRLQPAYALAKNVRVLRGAALWQADRPNVGWTKVRVWLRQWCGPDEQALRGPVALFQPGGMLRTHDLFSTVIDPPPTARSCADAGLLQGFGPRAD